MKESFLKKVSDDKAQKLFEKYKDKGLYLITEWGAVGDQDNDKWVLKWGEENDNNWFGTINNLRKSENGVMVWLENEEINA